MRVVVCLIHLVSGPYLEKHFSSRLVLFFSYAFKYANCIDKYMLVPFCAEHSETFDQEKEIFITLRQLYIHGNAVHSERPGNLWLIF